MKQTDIVSCVDASNDLWKDRGIIFLSDSLGKPIESTNDSGCVDVTESLPPSPRWNEVLSI